jgi:hypothetical protein
MVQARSLGVIHGDLPELRTSLHRTLAGSHALRRYHPDSRRRELHPRHQSTDGLERNS